MTTESKRASVKAYHARRTATGARKVTVWLSEEARERLSEMAKVAGSKDAAAERAIMMAPSVAQVATAPFAEDEG